MNPRLALAGLVVGYAIVACSSSSSSGGGEDASASSSSSGSSGGGSSGSSSSGSSSGGSSSSGSSGSSSGGSSSGGADAGADSGFVCTAASECADAAVPVCCATIPVTGGTVPNCTNGPATSQCTTSAACPITFTTLICSGSEILQLCSKNADCANVAPYNQCCTFSKGGGSLSFCANTTIAGLGSGTCM